MTVENPPGLYGTEAGIFAHNLLLADTALAPVTRPQISVPLLTERYAFDESRDMKGPLLAAALTFMVLDSLIVLWLTGLFSHWRRTNRRTIGGATAAMMAALVVAAALLAFVPRASAQDAKPGDAQAVEAISMTRLAYVITGDPAIDSISRAGLEGLSRFLIEKTALEPGDPAGVDLEKDELSFYPIIYWPVDAGAVMPSESAIAHIDEYMKEGGSAVRHARPGCDRSRHGAASPATERLRDILAHLNVPPLEPVPQDHVLTKSFFILPEFPGRFNGSPLWVEASLDAENTENRPVRAAQVTPIMITANDFARRLGGRPERRPDVAETCHRTRCSASTPTAQGQHHHVHADRQLQIRPGARAGPAATAGAMR